MRLAVVLVATSLASAFLGFVAGRESPRQAISPGVVSAPAPAPSGIAVKAVAEKPAPAPAAVAASGVHALNLLRVALDTKDDKAQACLVFSGAIAHDADFHAGDFLRITPVVRPALQADGDRVCLGGLAFGTQYSLTVLAGLRGADGSRTLADETLPLSLGDLPAREDFADDGFILSREAAHGLPIATVNLSKVHLRVDRITDRVLVRTHLGQGYADYDGENTLGVPLWEGDLSVKGGRNEKVVTAFPLAQVLSPPGQEAQRRLPGAYRITLVRKRAGRGGEDEEDGGTTRWIFDTALMLTTHRGADGLHVFVRSLTTAKPAEGAEVSLLAANNDELGRARTDADGQAVFAAGLMRGVAGHVPRMVMAYRGDDFSALQLDKPGFDLSDRGVDGRPDPGPVDAYLYTDRGIYRPGETVQLGTVVRDRLALPLPDGQAVSVALLRPDGVEAGRWRLVPNAAGVAVQAIALNPSAARGTWRLEEMLAGTKETIGTLEIQVQDFVPNRLAVELTPRQPRIAAGAPTLVDVASRYLYGAPAADLAVAAHVQLQRDPAPVAERGWQFGRDGEVLNAQAQDITGPQTDAQGHATLSIDAAALKVPETSLPLRADITVSVAEPGGRATESQVSLPVTTKPVLLGLKAPEAGSIGEDRSVSIPVAAFAPDGTRLARPVAFRLIEQITDYNYFSENGRWQWKIATRERPVTFGTLDVPAAEGGAPVALPALPWGTYRLEVSDAASGAFSSVVLHAGFSAETEAADSPEKVTVSLVGPAPRAGGTATLHIKPPFAGKMLVCVENSRVLAVQTADIPAGGADVTVPAREDWGVGAYVVASIYRPSGEAAGHAPVRAVGLAYVKLDVSARTLGVVLDVPKVARPRSHLDLPVTVSGEAARGDVWLTLAAVDEGILQLTRFASPDPAAHFFGKRRLAVDIRDDYAHLIDGNAAAPGEIRAGGDVDGAGLSVVPTKTVALFSGLVRVGADGHAVVPLDLPDFTGGLRLMAVAVSGTGFGHAEAAVPVRDAVVAQVSLPRFLAPGDAARLTLLAHDVEAPAGVFHVHLSAKGALSMPVVDEDIRLAWGQAVVRTYPLNGGMVGNGRVDLMLTGPGGLRVAHDWEMEVRTPFQSETRVSRADQAAGASVVLSPELARGFSPHGATIRASFSAIGGIDLPGLLAALDEYPFGCSEQLVSRALPLLYVEQEGKLAGGVVPGDLRLRVQDAVGKLLERQDESGAFGLWRVGDGQAEPFLGAEITDFLMRARAHGYAVPEYALTLAARALADMNGEHYQLRRFWFHDGNEQHYRDEGVVRAGKAYALLLAARAGQAEIGDLRYMHDTELDDLEPLGQAQLATGLALLGDRARAEHAFDAAERGVAQEQDGLIWRLGDFYRTRLRDTAALVSLAAETGDRPRVDRLLAALDGQDMRTERLTTQEQGWLVIAAGVLLERAGPVTISVDGAAQPPAAIVTVQRGVEGLSQVSVRNAGAGVVTRMVAVRGLPLVAPPASASQISVEKTVTAADGGAVDLGHLKQNQRLVVHLSGAVDDDAYHQTMLVDPLPAGFEIERVVAPSTEAQANGLPWLGEITPVRIAEKRDDRFMAAIDLGRVAQSDDPKAANPGAFNIAYVVRVVSPGRFVLPAASIRGMYRPDMQARGAVGVVNVDSN